MQDKIKPRSALDNFSVVFKWLPEEPNSFVIQTFDLGGHLKTGYVIFDENGEITDRDINPFLNFASYSCYQQDKLPQEFNGRDVDDVLTDLIEGVAKYAYGSLTKGLDAGKIDRTPKYFNTVFIVSPSALKLLPVFQGVDGTFYMRDKDGDIPIPFENILIEEN